MIGFFANDGPSELQCRPGRQADRPHLLMRLATKLLRSPRRRYCGMKNQEKRKKRKRGKLGIEYPCSITSETWPRGELVTPGFRTRRDPLRSGAATGRPPLVSSPDRRRWPLAADEDWGGESPPVAA